MTKLDDRFRSARAELDAALGSSTASPGVVVSLQRQRRARSVAALAVVVAVVAALTVRITADGNDTPVVADGGRHWPEMTWTPGAFPPDDAKLIFAGRHEIISAPTTDSVYYVASGGTAAGSTVMHPAANWRYDVARDRWNRLADVPVDNAFVSLTAAVFDAQLYTVGLDCVLSTRPLTTSSSWVGCDSDKPHKIVVARYEARTDSWQRLPAPAGLEDPATTLSPEFVRSTGTAPTLAYHRQTSAVIAFPQAPSHRVVDSLHQWDEQSEAWTVLPSHPATLPAGERGFMCANGAGIWAAPTESNWGPGVLPNPPIAAATPLTLTVANLAPGESAWRDMSVEFAVAGDINSLDLLRLGCTSDAVLLFTVGAGDAPGALLRPGLVAVISGDGGVMHRTIDRPLSRFSRLQPTNAGFVAGGSLTPFVGFSERAEPTTLPDGDNDRPFWATAHFVVRPDTANARFEVLALTEQLR